MADIQELEQKVLQLQKDILAKAAKDEELIGKSKKAIEYALHAFKIDHYGFIWTWDIEKMEYRKTKMRIMTPEIPDKAIQSRHIANGAVTREKIDDGAIDDIYAVFKDLVDNYKPIVINGNVTNAPDEEDITSKNGLLKLKNRSSVLSNKGYVILRRGISLSEQISLINTIYEIKYDFDLNGNTVEMPTGCVLKFNGGILTNGTIVGSDTSLDAGVCKIFDDSIFFDGTWNVRDVYPEWFGAENNNVVDCVTAFNKSFQFLDVCKVSEQYYRIDKSAVNLVLQGGEYYISEPLTISSNFNIFGNNAKIVIKRNMSHVLFFDHAGLQWPYSGNIVDLQIEGNAHDADAIVFGDCAGTLIQNVRIRNCIGIGIHFLKGLEIVVRDCEIGLMTHRIAEAYANSDILKNGTEGEKDYSKLIGILATEITTDSLIDSVFVQNIPRGIIVDNSFMINNVHVWGLVKDIEYGGQNILSTFTNVTIAITVLHNCQLTNIYADSFFRQDASKGRTVPVNGIVNGGWGIYVGGQHNYISGMFCHANVNEFSPNFVLSTENPAVYLNKSNNTVCNILYGFGDSNYYAGATMTDPATEQLENTIFNCGEKVNYLNEGNRSSVDILSRVQCVEGVDTIATNVNLGKSPSKKKALRLYAAQKSIGELLYNTDGTVSFTIGDIFTENANGFKAEVIKNVISGILLHLSHKSNIPSDESVNALCRGSQEYRFAEGDEGVVNIPYLFYRFNARNYRLEFSADANTFGDSNNIPFIGQDIPPGFQYFNTDLNKPIWWNGGYWVDASGTRITWPITFNISFMTYQKKHQPLVGQSYLTAIVADDGYTLPETIYVSMGGVELTQSVDYAYNPLTGVIEIIGSGGEGGVTGEVIIQAVAERNNQ